MAGTGGPKPGGANMEFKEMKEGATIPPTVEYEHIKACCPYTLSHFFSNFNLWGHGHAPSNDVFAILTNCCGTVAVQCAGTGRWGLSCSH